MEHEFAHRGRYQESRSPLRTYAKIAGNGRYAIRSRAERARAQSAPAVRTVPRQNPFDREILGARPRRARLHLRRQVYQPRLDRVDAGLPIRIGHPSVRCHGRNRIPGDRARAHRRRDGAAPQPHRRSRSRVQQRQHLRQPAPPDEGGPDCGEPLGAPLLRGGAEGVRRRAGRALVAHRRGRRVYLLVQRPAPAVSHLLGHVLMGENDQKISLIDRVAQHARATAKYAVWYGEGRDAYDVRGRTAHESIFNVNDGNYRCPNSQQGYSPFSTWTRGLAWAMCGFAEQLELFDTLPEHEETIAIMEKAARATCDFYIAHTPPDGIPYWDTGAPGLANLGDWRSTPADPYNEHEPVDSSAAAIGAQGLLRLGRRLKDDRYFHAGLKVCDTLFDEPYLSTDENHQGLILHSVYHRPNGWDAIPANAKIPAGESSMWGDYHAREVGLYLLRLIEGKPYLRFW